MEKYEEAYLSVEAYKGAVGYQGKNQGDIIIPIEPPGISSKFTTKLIDVNEPLPEMLDQIDPIPRKGTGSLL